MPNLPRPAPNPDLDPTVPTLCDQCRAQGVAGESPFEDLAGLLDFTPVPVRAHANNWTPQHQRAFVAALAIVGTEREAARSIGRYAAGAIRLRKLPRGKSFAEACDNALDLYRERELAGLQASMVKLQADASAAADHRRDVYANVDYHREPERMAGDEEDPEDVADARARIAAKLWGCRQAHLALICHDPAKRAAYELLTGQAIDWERVERGEPQDDEIEARQGSTVRPPLMRNADMVVVASAVAAVTLGWDGEALADL